MPDPAEPAPATFGGRPRHYLRISIGLGLGLPAYLYGGMVVIEYLIRGEAWILGWKPVVAAIVFAALYMRLSYRWMMDLDGQLGSGSRWSLPERIVRLPERGHRPEV
ncbi:MAG: hypothetical protein P4L83_24035 [Nevskia sp.]|nr:hypothetical protein [Nevskia sp.]